MYTLTKATDEKQRQNALINKECLFLSCGSTIPDRLDYSKLKYSLPIIDPDSATCYVYTWNKKEYFFYRFC